MFPTGKLCRGALAILATLALAGCGTRAGDDGTPGEVVVFAAASLRDALAELAPVVEAGCGATPLYNFAGSNVLARQIEAAPAADLFLSADERWADELETAGRLVPGTRRTLLSNRLVVVARPDGPALSGPADLAGPGYAHLSIGDPEGVPAGVYARRFLEGAGLWEAVAGRVVPAPDVRAALALVEARDDAVGIVYTTDARSSEKVRVLFEVPAGNAPEIRYTAAAVAGGPAGEATARSCLEALAGGEALAVFERHGFSAPDAEAGPR